MLRSLSIQNLSSIRAVRLRLDPRLNVITGATGAGKTSLFNAIGFAFGLSKKIYLTNNNNDGLVEAELLLNQETRRKILADTGLDLPEHVRLERILRRDNTTKARINNASISFTQLRSLGVSAVGVYMAGKFLHRNIDYRDILDRFGKIDASELACLYQQIHKLDVRLDELASQKELFDPGRCELAKELLAEIDSLSLQNNEEQRLLERINEQRAIYKNISILTESLHAIKDRKIAKAASLLEKIAGAETTSLAKELYAIDLALNDIAERLNGLRNTNANLEQIDEWEQRLSLLRKIARKHRCNVSDLEVVSNNLKQQLDDMEVCLLEKNKTVKKKEALTAQYLAAALCISQHRKEAAQKFRDAALTDLALLGMRNASLEAVIRSDYERAIGPCGMDSVQFMVSTMQHRQPSDLCSTLSGGEFARFMLAVYKITNCSSGMLLLDEPDAGTSGEAAACIGRYMANVAEKMQLIVITHQPQAIPQNNLHLNATKIDHMGYSEIVISTQEEKINQITSKKTLRDFVVDSIDQ